MAFIIPGKTSTPAVPKTATFTTNTAPTTGAFQGRPNVTPKARAAMTQAANTIHVQPERATPLKMGSFTIPATPPDAGAMTPQEAMTRKAVSSGWTMPKAPVTTSGPVLTDNKNYRAPTWLESQIAKQTPIGKTVTGVESAGSALPGNLRTGLDYFNRYTDTALGTLGAVADTLGYSLDKNTWGIFANKMKENYTRIWSPPALTETGVPAAIGHAAGNALSLVGTALTAWQLGKAVTSTAQQFQLNARRIAYNRSKLPTDEGPGLETGGVGKIPSMRIEEFNPTEAEKADWIKYVTEEFGATPEDAKLSLSLMKEAVESPYSEPSGAIAYGSAAKEPNFAIGNAYSGHTLPWGQQTEIVEGLPPGQATVLDFIIENPKSAASLGVVQNAGDISTLTNLANAVNAGKAGIDALQSAMTASIPSLGVLAHYATLNNEPIEKAMSEQFGLAVPVAGTVKTTTPTTPVTSLSTIPSAVPVGQPVTTKETVPPAKVPSPVFRLPPASTVPVQSKVYTVPASATSDKVGASLLPSTAPAPHTGASFVIPKKANTAPATEKQPWEMTPEERQAKITGLQTQYRSELSTPLMSEGAISATQLNRMGTQQRKQYEKRVSTRYDVESMIYNLEHPDQAKAFHDKSIEEQRTSRIDALQSRIADLKHVGLSKATGKIRPTYQAEIDKVQKELDALTAPPQTSPSAAISNQQTSIPTTQAPSAPQGGQNEAGAGATEINKPVSQMTEQEFVSKKWSGYPTAPAGYTILYHATPESNVDAILKDGIKVGTEHSDGRGGTVWATLGPTDYAKGNALIAFKVPIGDPSVTDANKTDRAISRNIDPSDIVQIYHAVEGDKAGIAISTREDLAWQMNDPGDERRKLQYRIASPTFQPASKGTVTTPTVESTVQKLANTVAGKLDGYTYNLRTSTITPVDEHGNRVGKSIKGTVQDLHDLSDKLDKELGRNTPSDLIASQESLIADIKAKDMKRLGHLSPAAQENITAAEKRIAELRTQEPVATAAQGVSQAIVTNHPEYSDAVKKAILAVPDEAWTRPEDSLTDKEYSALRYLEMLEDAPPWYKSNADGRGTNLGNIQNKDSYGYTLKKKSGKWILLDTKTGNVVAGPLGGFKIRDEYLNHVVADAADRGEVMPDRVITDYNVKTPQVPIIAPATTKQPERRTTAPQTREETDRQIDELYNKGDKEGIKRLLASVRDQARTDPLTGLKNGVGWEEADKVGKTVTSCDLSGLKWINDKFGHEIGDLLIRLVGAAFRSQGIDAYHIHGDEFAALFASPQEADTKMAAVQKALAETPIVTETNGQSDSWTGWRLDYGTGKTYKDADDALIAKRTAEEEQGTRSPRGSQPRGVTSSVAEKNKDQRGIAAVKAAAQREQDRVTSLTPWLAENRQPTARELFNWVATNHPLSSRNLFDPKEAKNIRFSKLFPAQNSSRYSKTTTLDQLVSYLKEVGVQFPDPTTINLDDWLSQQLTKGAYAKLDNETHDIAGQELPSRQIAKAQQEAGTTDIFGNKVKTRTAAPSEAQDAELFDKGQKAAFTTEQKNAAERGRHLQGQNQRTEQAVNGGENQDENGIFPGEIVNLPFDATNNNLGANTNATGTQVNQTADDDAYSAAVESGDMETAQKMVDAAARAAGYTLGPVWHGSPNTVQNKGWSKAVADIYSILAPNEQPLNPNASTLDKDQSEYNRFWHFANALKNNVQKVSGRIPANTLRVYNNGQRVPFDTFDPARKGESTGALDARRGFFFSKNEQFARQFMSRYEVEAITGTLHKATSGPSSLLRAFLRPGRILDLTNEPERVSKAGQKYSDITGYDTVINKVKWNPDINKKLTRVTEEIMVIDPTQIKSAEPTVYDAEGNLVPLSQRFAPSSPVVTNTTGVPFGSYTTVVPMQSGTTARTIAADNIQKVVNTVKDYTKSLARQLRAARMAGKKMTGNFSETIYQREFAKRMSDLGVPSRLFTPKQILSMYRSTRNSPDRLLDFTNRILNRLNAYNDAQTLLADALNDVPSSVLTNKQKSVLQSATFGSSSLMKSLDFIDKELTKAQVTADLREKFDDMLADQKAKAAARLAKSQTVAAKKLETEKLKALFDKQAAQDKADRAKAITQINRMLGAVHRNVLSGHTIELNYVDTIRSITAGLVKDNKLMADAAKQMTTAQLQQLSGAIKVQVAVGRLAYMADRAQREATINATIARVLPLLKSMAGYKTKQLDLANYRDNTLRYGRLRNAAAKLGQGITPAETIFRMLGLREMYMDFLGGLTDTRQITDSWRAERLAKAKELGIATDRQQRRIGIWLINQTPGGREHLIYGNYKDMTVADAEKYIDSVVLTPQEQQYADFMRDHFNRNFPALRDYFRDFYNIEVTPVDSYTSLFNSKEFESDYEHDMKELAFKNAVTGQRKTPAVSMAKARIGGRNSVELNIFRIGDSYDDTLGYAMEFGPRLQKWTGVVNDEAVMSKLGDLGNIYVRSTLINLVYRGGPGGRTAASKMDYCADWLRKNLSRAQILLRPTSAILQALQISNVAGIVGQNNVVRATSLLISDDKHGEWVKKNFPLLRDSVRNYFEILGMPDDKLTRVTGAMFRWCHDAARTTGAIANYMYVCQQAGIPVDWEHPDKKLLLEAMVMVNQEFGAEDIVSLPAALETGYGFGDDKSLARLLLQFQQDTLAKFDVLKTRIPGFAHKDAKRAIRALFWMLLVGTGLVAGARYTYRKGIKALTGAKQSEKDTYLLEYLKDLTEAVPFGNVIQSIFEYGDIPVPALSVPVDATKQAANYFHYKNGYAKLRAAVRLGTDVGTIFGVPGIGTIGQIAGYMVPTKTTKKGTKPMKPASKKPHK